MNGIQLDNETKDLCVKNKALQVGETNEQRQYLILQTQPGEWKEFPTLGVGIENYTNETDYSALKYSIRENLKADGLKVTKLEITDNKLTLEAEDAD